AMKTRNSPMKGPNDPEWLMKTLCWDDIGTDPNTAVNFADAYVDLTRTGLTTQHLRAIAHRELDQWYQRQRVYLEEEVAALKADPSTLAQAAPFEKQLAGLADEEAQKISQIDAAKLPVGNGLSY